MSLTCLDTLIGLTDLDCDCFTTNRPVGYNTSDSGLFIIDPDYGFPSQEAAIANLDCEDDFWGSLVQAKAKAITTLKTDLRRVLSEVRNNPTRSFKGTIGRTKWTNYKSPSQDTVGIQFRPKHIRDGYFVLTKLHLGMNTTGSFEVSLKSTDHTFTEQTYTISCTAGQIASYELPTPFEIPLQADIQPDLFYYFEYQPGDAKPIDNTFTCCGRKLTFQSFGAFGGYTFDSEENFDRYGKYTNNSANGLVIEGYYACNSLDWICSLDQLDGYDLKGIIARSLQFKAAHFLISKVIHLGNINKYSLMDSELLTERAQVLDSYYNDNLLFIANNLPVNYSGCWGCKKDSPQVHSILT